MAERGSLFRLWRPSAAAQILAAATLAVSGGGGALAAVGDRLDLAGLIQLPTEDWTAFSSELYTAATARSCCLMWRSSWTPAGDSLSAATLSQSVMNAAPYGHTNSRVVDDGPTKPTALHYDPFSIVTRADGTKALRITPAYLASPSQRDKVWGYPIVSGELSTAGRNTPGMRNQLAFYQSDYSVTVYHAVRLPLRMWGALWKYAKRDYGGGGLTEIDLLETMGSKWPQFVWLTLHSSDDTWLKSIVDQPSVYDPHLTQWAGAHAVSLRYPGLAHSDPHALHDWALVVGPKVVQWAVDGVVVFEVPTPRDVADHPLYDTIDLDYGVDLPPPTSDGDLDYMEVGKIERYTYPGVSHVQWHERDVGDGAAVEGAKRLPGTNFQ